MMTEFQTIDFDPDTSQKLYATLPLDPKLKQIRVLDVQPTPDGDESPVVGKLGCVSLLMTPEFAALLYVWGAFTKPPITITCNSQGVPVTQNCQAALQALRKRLGPFTIWIDAVCINQNDNLEKASQIPLMGEIYSMADRAYLWLGQATEVEDNAMSYLQRAGFQNVLIHDGPHRYSVPRDHKLCYRLARETYFQQLQNRIRGSCVLCSVALTA